MAVRETRRSFLTAAAFLVLASASSRLAAAADDPIAFARSLYALPMLWSDATEDDATMAKYLAPKLAALVAENYKKDDFESALNYDPLVQAQDFDEIKPKFKLESRKDNDATVTAAFENFGEKVTVTLDLLLTAKGWRLADIRTEDGNSLAVELTELNAKRR